tara:strand:+ start:674 stop:907 length:234 start_codon:yes stop_codon:yes gene_type:complete
LNEAHTQLSIVIADPRAQAFVYDFGLSLDAQIALRIALVANDTDGWFVNEVDLGTEFPCNTHCLGTPAGISVDQNGL